MKTNTTFTAATAKLIKSASRTYCQIYGADNIICIDGYVMLCVGENEYRDTVLPVTGVAAGNWKRENGEISASDVNLVKMWDEAVQAVISAAPLEVSPLRYSGDYSVVGLYDHSTGTVTAANPAYMRLVNNDTYKTAAPAKPIVAYSGENPVAVIMPMRITDEFAAAVRAYYRAPEPTTPAEDPALTAARERIAALELELQSRPAPSPEPEKPEPAADIVARLTAIPGISAIVKGAKTSAPVIWLSGDVAAHATELEAAGAKWSVKRSAYYCKA